MTKTTITTIAVSILAFIVAVVALIGHGSPAVKVGAVNPSGGNVYYQVDTYTSGLNIGSKYETYIPLVMPIGTNQVSWCNNTGNIVIASAARFNLASTTYNGNVVAKNTLDLSVSTSTTSTLSISTAAAASTTLAAGTLIAASAISANATAFDGGSAPILSSTAIAVSPSECLVASLLDPNNATGQTGTATSTARGYVLNGIVQISY